METPTHPFSDDDDWFARRRAPISTDEDSFERGTVLDGLKLCVRSRQFRGGRLTSVLAGVTLDLRQATLAPEGATINLQSALSGIDILVPRDWEVECDVNAIGSGVDGARPPSLAPRPRPRLRVTGMVVACGLFVR